MRRAFTIIFRHELTAEEWRRVQEVLRIEIERGLGLHSKSRAWEK